jgi:hypothetical protein
MSKQTMRSELVPGDSFYYYRACTGEECNHIGCLWSGSRPADQGEGVGIKYVAILGLKGERLDVEEHKCCPSDHPHEVEKDRQVYGVQTAARPGLVGACRAYLSLKHRLKERGIWLRGGRAIDALLASKETPGDLAVYQRHRMEVSYTMGSTRNMRPEDYFTSDVAMALEQDILQQLG